MKELTGCGSASGTSSSASVEGSVPDVLIDCKKLEPVEGQRSSERRGLIVTGDGRTGSGASLDLDRRGRLGEDREQRESEEGRSKLHNFGCSLWWVAGQRMLDRILRPKRWAASGPVRSRSMKRALELQVLADERPRGAGPGGVEESSKKEMFRVVSKVSRATRIEGGGERARFA